MRTITNIKNKNTGLFSCSLMAHQPPQAAIFHFGQFRVSQGQQGSDTYVFYSPDGGGHPFIFGATVCKKMS
jgi:hypothetical protein